MTKCDADHFKHVVMVILVMWKEEEAILVFCHPHPSQQSTGNMPTNYESVIHARKKKACIISKEITMQDSKIHSLVFLLFCGI